MVLEEITQKLKRVLDKQRYEHSLGVMETSEVLARRYGENPEKAALAGLLHDCGKNYKGEPAKLYMEKAGLSVDWVERINTRLLHGPIGAHLAQTLYGIEDEAILNAVRWHTTGRAGMSLLEKIVFVADYIEPNRKLEDIEQMRKAALESLELCMVLCCDSTIRYVMKKGAMLHPRTVETRNESLLLIKEKAH